MISQAAIRRALKAARDEIPGSWLPLAGDVEVRFIPGFPDSRWELVAGFEDQGHTITNRDEASATSLAAAVREAVRLLEGSPERSTT